MSNDLRHWAREQPEQVAIEIGTQVLRYAEMEAQANRLARVFRDLGLARGDHVAALLGNSPFPLVMAWAAWRSGLYFTPLSTALSTPELIHVLRDCDARLVVVDGRFAVRIDALREQADAVAHWFSHGSRIDHVEAIEGVMAQELGLPRVDESPGALMLYTSGTTGSPRGVWRPLPQATGQGTPSFAADLIALFELDAGVRYLSTAPLYHAAPLRLALAVTASGGQVQALEKFDPDQALRRLADCSITHSQWVPTMFQRLLQLPRARREALIAPRHAVAIHAAAPCPVAVKQAMIDWWGPILLEYYSGTEGVGLTMIDSHEWRSHPGSVGRARKGVLHVVDDAGRELLPGQVGRIYFSGVAPFQYFRDREKTAACTLSSGWQTLGDIGHVDAEGYLYLTDRADDMIISGGVNVYPQEIEAAILELSEVADCAVVGVPDDAFGERPVAIVVGAVDLSAAQLADCVRAHCGVRLGRIKQPDRLLVWPEIPRTAAGKLVRRELRSRILSGC
jgi:long-chain acyl-CoA synthetase